ncbi:MAG: DUF4250 domain-containing protein [Inconstantimicrobium porci]|uniref:DUF4250 domain-containing protein n=1 Tax=Inconstantimicrobium porci TaxID=2652291 RepID=A0A7X2MX04_9CLOT|nr:DUF4250 domain-containing protein [Inconstantimicrobium porci]MDD6771193.1 DUF4250 domain-containing protein [Inconstantimicrobium porci]MDY5910716.1 DUF4250 domain-containing protein [Inconstantimicrobium porci]MSR90643.1 DUF4250 domain-containing protein [Inconstantimicrobium porci]
MEITNELVSQMDPFMLLSVINMKLRDFYSSLNDLCEDNDIDKSLLVSRFENINYEYSENLNQIVAK